MRDISCTATAATLEALERMGVNATEVTTGLSVDAETLRSPFAGHIDWATFATLLDRVGERIGPQGLERLGAMVLEAPSYRWIRAAARLLISPRQAVRLTDRIIGPTLFPIVEHTLTELPDGRLRLRLALPAGLRPSEAYFLMVAGNLRAVPTLFGLSGAAMEAVIDGPAATFTLRLPDESLMDRARRAAEVLRQPGRMLEDLQQRRRALENGYEALARFRRDFHTVIDRLPDGVTILRGGVVLYANRAVVGMLGYDRLDELVGRSVASFLPPEEQDRVATALARHQGQPPPGELSLLRKDGRQVVFDVLPVQVIDFEGQRANLVVVRDVTERKRLQQQLMLTDRMASLGTLAAGVAHEVNNPLAYAHISLHTLGRQLAEIERGRPAEIDHLQAMRETLAAAQHGIDRVRTIVGDLKTFSRPDDETIEPVDVHRVLESAISMAGKELRHRARLVRDYGEVPAVLANDARLGQVFLNLLVNAAQALPEERAAKNTIRLRTSAPAPGYVTIDVIDDGPGIPPDILERVFVPFVTTKPSGVGTGLGLSICHRIVTRLGGQIEVESSPERGTTVHITLPAAARSLTPLPAPNVAASPEPERRARVLVVDDEPVLLSTLESLLATSHDVVTAASGRRALEILDGDSGFDMILCDLMMNEITGMDVYEHVQSTQPELAERIVFMTGGAFTNATRRFLAQLDNPCLDKPFTVDEVMGLIRDRIAI